MWFVASSRLANGFGARDMRSTLYTSSQHMDQHAEPSSSPQPSAAHSHEHVAVSTARARASSSLFDSSFDSPSRWLRVKLVGCTAPGATILTSFCAWQRERCGPRRARTKYDPNLPRMPVCEG
eukprot:scaffold35173_cov63-Phaeocystis_antarctica.AAC.5